MRQINLHLKLHEAGTIIIFVSPAKPELYNLLSHRASGVVLQPSRWIVKSWLISYLLNKDGGNMLFLPSKKSNTHVGGIVNVLA